jgi:probable phosphoglycerate mutase
MTTFYICRHGQTENNKAQRLSGWSDSPLTNVGLNNVQTSARKLDSVTLDAIYSSDLGRAFFTAYDIADHIGFRERIRRRRGLRENNYGDITGMLISQAELVYPNLHQTNDFKPPNGESLTEFQNRVLSDISSIAETQPNKHVLLAVHDGVIKALYAKFSNRNLAELHQSSDYANDFVGVFTYMNNGIASFDELI